jgi:hypothetical protein
VLETPFDYKRVEQHRKRGVQRVEHRSDGVHETSNDKRKRKRDPRVSTSSVVMVCMRQLMTPSVGIATAVCCSSRQINVVAAEEADVTVGGRFLCQVFRTCRGFGRRSNV